MSDSSSVRKPGDALAPHAPASLLGGGGGGHHVEEGGEGNWLVSYADMMTLLVGFFVILLSFSSVDQEKFEEARRSVTQEFGGQFQVPYSELADRLREVAKKLGVGDQFLIKESDVGIEISSRGTVFFDTGSAELKDEAKPVLANLISVLKSELSKFNVTIEGHTDDVPLIGGKTFRNNFELSSIRACRVLEAFLLDGFPKSQLTAVGYGESRPLVPNRDSEGNAIAENQGQNRRVVIKILKPSEPLLKTEKDTATASAAPAHEGEATAEAAGETAPEAAPGTAPEAATGTVDAKTAPTIPGAPTKTEGPAPASVHAAAPVVPAAPAPSTAMAPATAPVAAAAASIQSEKSAPALRVRSSMPASVVPAAPVGAETVHLAPALPGESDVSTH